MMGFCAIVALSSHPVNYGGRIWWVEPSFKANVVKVKGFIEFETPLVADNLYLLDGGRIFIRRENDVSVYDPAFNRLYSMENLQDVGKEVCGGCELDIVDPFMDGERVLAGFADRRSRKYYLVEMNLSSGSRKVLRVLDAFHFPEIAPIMKVRKMMKEDPDFVMEYLAHFYEYGHFQPHPVVDGRVYLWFYPDYGLHFGGLYVYDLRRDSLVSVSDRIDRFLGSGNGFFAYTLMEDEDAMTVERAIYVNKKGRVLKLEDADGHAALVGGSFIFYRIYDTDTYALYDVGQERVISKVKIDAEDMRPLALSPSGRLVFFSGKLNGKNGLYVYDFSRGEFVNMFPEATDLHFSSVNTCFDGEFFAFLHRDDVWAGYGADETAPVVHLKVNPSRRGIAFQKKVKVIPEVEDRCFVSSARKDISINGRNVKSGEGISVNLKEGKNILKIRASDMAGNVLDTVVEVVYMEPIKVKIAQIGENPEEFSGKVVVLEGYGKGWMAKGSECSGLPTARGNTARSRSDGTFCDETASVFFPIAPRESGRFRVYALVKIVKGGWILEPVKVERLE